MTEQMSEPVEAFHIHSNMPVGTRDMVYTAHEVFEPHNRFVLLINRPYFELSSPCPIPLASRSVFRPFQFILWPRCYMYIKTRIIEGRYLKVHLGQACRIDFLYINTDVFWKAA